ncbi:biotin/lipoyl-containing protein, partial [Bordetella pertussis]|uniref:biotin/lipoyl-containing protein n=1 Tax=Bordetella pertussis TaxID=520 RepID=UPI00291C54A3
MSNIVEIKVPDIGDFKEVEVIEVLVSAGDTIKAEQSLITVESDKASMEIPASAAGVVKSVKVKVGDKIAEGTVILEVEAAGEAAAAPKAEAPKAEAPKAEQAAETPKADDKVAMGTVIAVVQGQGAAAAPAAAEPAA